MSKKRDVKHPNFNVTNEGIFEDDTHTPTCTYNLTYTYPRCTMITHVYTCTCTCVVNVVVVHAIWLVSYNRWRCQLV